MKIAGQAIGPGKSVTTGGKIGSVGLGNGEIGTHVGAGQPEILSGTCLHSYPGMQSAQGRKINGQAIGL